MKILNALEAELEIVLLIEVGNLNLVIEGAAKGAITISMKPKYCRNI